MALTQILTTDSVSASVVNAKIVGPANTALALTDTNLDNLETEVSSHLADIASQDDGKGADMVGLPDPNNLFNATNVGGAMQELFTNVSNGKDLVGGAITDVDDSVVIPTDPTFNDLASAIGGISTGKKWVSGIANTSNDWGTSQQFEVVDESKTAPNISVEITGIGFIPSFIILTNIANKRIIIYSAEHDGFATNTVKLISNYSGNIGNAALENYKGNKLPAYVNENGFKLPVGGNLGLVFNWIAIE